MDAGVGRFLQSDPIMFEAQDFNLYAYVSNDPTNYIDPHGLTKKKGGPRHPELTVMDFAKAELREAAIEAVATGVFAMTGQIVGQLALGEALLEAAMDSKGGGTHLHHCNPKYLGGTNHANNLKKIDAAKHRFLHKAMRLYLRTYDLDYAPGYGGKFIRKRFPVAAMQRITRNFYRDMKEQFDIDFGC